ncbi:D-alanyl-D-alanine carboxypeptidase/D-alanyl-D-alanine-endopeptidase [Oceaniovalibus guishaninsula JLT2003]|uniref:D-alanyl-D-alanine carboxypeptidase/D-alanyl-D-alanine-endopeptidase n=1 Tax=Oceaniovalibus guishaninsula JLT2003 TaxID=1231392 RepID=K2HD03_9RHOB|nr:D-alanyl-D-alanine carboxypeptidase/D-alanyl-D-alanine-endopeptidase [Oceaniovalibus guishaninsula]EKE45313.1 D-alanyl-D-alanine carboxypeptidase/D-alanyl-D-alanine-endopeptidase [Oceaniovalibus guishaninsula JLT2003]
MPLTRRTMLAGLLAGAAGRAWAEAPETAFRPRPRAPDFFRRAIPTADALIARAGLGGKVSFVLADARSGAVLEQRAPLLPLPPASTAKALTALYARDALGPDRRFTTRLVATGPIVNGRIDGDLILAGGGDPHLDTDALAGMAAALKALGVTAIGGALQTWAGALPGIERIDDRQPQQVGYNPALGGLNLNFNRVHFEWKRDGTDYAVAMDARSGRLRPAIDMARMQVIDRRLPVYTYASKDGRDDWTVARAALGAGGSRWLPVRRPDLYAGQALLAILRGQGIACDGPVGRRDTLPPGDVLVAHDSPPLDAILRDLLKYSTNVTAELVGLTATRERGWQADGLAASAARMNDWLQSDLGLRRPMLEDHSGLGDDSRISARDLTRAMVAAGWDGPLRGLMKPFSIDEAPALHIRAKTGSLNFVSTLTGYLSAPDAPDMAFAIFCADLPRRDALDMADRERPPGGIDWARRARGLQRALLTRWGAWYAV